NEIVDNKPELVLYFSPVIRRNDQIDQGSPLIITIREAFFWLAWRAGQDDSYKHQIPQGLNVTFENQSSDTRWKYLTGQPQFPGQAAPQNAGAAGVPGTSGGNLPQQTLPVGQEPPTK